MALPAAERAERALTLDASNWSGLPEVQRVARAVESAPSVAVGGLWGSSQELMLAALTRHLDQLFVAVTSSEPEAQTFAEGLVLAGVDACVFAARAEMPGRRAEVDPDTVRERLQVAQRLAGPRARAAARRRRFAALAPAARPLAAGPRARPPAPAGRPGSSTRGPARAPGRGRLRARSRWPSNRARSACAATSSTSSRSRPSCRCASSSSTRRSSRCARFDPVEQRSVEIARQRVALSLASDAGGVEDGDGVPPVALLFDDHGRRRGRAAAHRGPGRRPAHPLGGARARARRAARGAWRSRAQARAAEPAGGDLDFDTRSVQALAGRHARRAGAPCARRARRRARGRPVRDARPSEHRFARSARGGRRRRRASRRASAASRKGFRLPALQA